MSFGSNIGYLRKKKGITQEALAEQMYVSRQTVSRWETDSVYPDVETVIRLCEILECDMETLVRGDASAEKEPAPVQEQEKEKETEKAKERKTRRIRSVPQRRRVDWDELNAGICALSFIIAIAAYLFMGFAYSLWHPGWWVFIAATVLCAVSSIVCMQILPALFGENWDSE